MEYYSRYRLELRRLIYHLTADEWMSLKRAI